MIGTKLKELRTKKGLTIANLCEQLKMNQNTYAKYERDERDVSTETLSKIADLYGVTTDYLLGREPAADPLQGLDITVDRVDNDNFIEAYERLPECVKQVFIDTMLKLSQAGAETNLKPTVNPVNDWTDEQLHAELDRQLKAEKTATAESEVS